MKNNKIVAVETHDGCKLIGVLVDPQEIKDIPLAKVRKDCIWIRRRTHLTYLPNNSVKKIRPAEYLEEEFDFPRF
jgi:hypothetical protein